MDSHAKSALRKELRHAEEQRERLDMVITYLRERLGLSDDEPENPPTAPRPTTRARRDASRPKRLTSAAAAERVLQDHGEPMRTTEILREVQSLGAQMKDADGMYKTMDRMPEKFRRVGRGLWGLTAWPSDHRGAELFSGEGR